MPALASRESFLRIPLRYRFPFLDAHPIFMTTTKTVNNSRISFCKQNPAPTKLTDGLTVH